jgi:D-alanyl-D-alanine endopeptidase (penicillin-binding protein 7)
MLLAVGLAVCVCTAHAERGAGKYRAHKSTHKRVHVSYPAPSEPAVYLGRDASPLDLHLRSAAVLVVDQNDGHPLLARNIETVAPIASITKLMTAMVALDSGAALDEVITISSAEIDTLKGTRSRLHVGVALPRRDLIHLALMASENRAAAALARAHPQGSSAFIAAMNRKALELGMSRTRFVDSTGLNSDNVSTAGDLVKMVTAAYRYPLIREFTTMSGHEVAPVGGGRSLAFRNSNGLVKNKSWEIGLSKTGYISEAGRCLVMQAQIAAKPVIIVLLDSWGKYTRLADANRIKRWMESALARRPLS